MSATEPIFRVGGFVTVTHRILIHVSTTRELSSLTSTARTAHAQLAARCPVNGDYYSADEQSYYLEALVSDEIVRRETRKRQRQGTLGEGDRAFYSPKANDLATINPGPRMIPVIPLALINRAAK